MRGWLASVPASLAKMYSVTPRESRTGRNTGRNRENTEETMTISLSAATVFTLSHTALGARQKNSGLSFDVGWAPFQTLL